MPLAKSPSGKAFKQNVKTLMHEQYPQKQALAIAYSIKRRNRRRGGRLNRAEGGDALGPEEVMPETGQPPLQSGVAPMPFTRRQME
jgi:hypothetical protein